MGGSAHQGVHTRVVAPALVGRADELDRLTDAVAGPPAVVTLEGEAGIGKTRLVTELAARRELAGRRFVVGRCRGIREPFPLGAVIDAVRGTGADLATAELSPVTGALRPLLPEVAQLLPPQPPPLDDRAGERHRVFRGFVELLAALGRAVLVLEDLHWADDQTTEFVGYLVGDPPEQLSVVLTFRGEQVASGLRAQVAEPPPPVRRAELTLAPLDEADTGALAAAILGTKRVPDAFGAHLWTRSSGLPLAIEELLALLRARGTLKVRDGRWARRALDELAVPSGIRDPVLERVSRLSAEARAVAEAAAVLGMPVPVPVLTATAQLSRSPALRGVDEALVSGLLVEHGPNAGFRHPLAAEAVSEALSAPRRRALHMRAAAALQDMNPVPLGQVAHHLRQAGRMEEWALVAEQAADQATALGHDAEAARLLEDLLRHTSLEPTRQGRLAVKLGRAAVETVHVTGGLIALLSAVRDRDLPAAVRGELGFTLALLHEAAGGDRHVVRRA